MHSWKHEFLYTSSNDKWILCDTIPPAWPQNEYWTHSSSLNYGIHLPYLKRQRITDESWVLKYTPPPQITTTIISKVLTIICFFYRVQYRIWLVAVCSSSREAIDEVARIASLTTSEKASASIYNSIPDSLQHQFASQENYTFVLILLS